MSGVEMNEMEQQARRPISAWTKALAVVAAPIAIFAPILIADSEQADPENPTVDYWLSEAQREDGAIWQIRRLAYDNFPNKLRDRLGLKDPGEAHERQGEAIRKLGGLTNEVDRIIPVLTNLLLHASNEEITGWSLVALAELETNAAKALPAVISLVSSASPYGRGDAWDTLFSIAPTAPEVVSMATNLLDQVIKEHSPVSFASKRIVSDDDSGIVWSLVSALPKLEIPFHDVESRFAKIFAFEEPTLVRQAMQALAVSASPWYSGDQTYTGEEIESLLGLWERTCSPAIKDVTVPVAIELAIQRKRTLPEANRLFSELLSRSDVSFQYWRPVFDRFSSVIPAEPQNLARTDAMRWVLGKEPNYYEDLGSFIELNCLREDWEDPRVKEWLFSRMAAQENPNQVADWSRCLATYGEVRVALQRAVEILQTKDEAKIEMLLRKLQALNPGMEGPMYDAEFLSRYGSSKPKSGKANDTLLKQLESIPLLEGVALVRQLLTEVERVDGSIKPKAKAHGRLLGLLSALEHQSSGAQ